MNRRLGTWNPSMGARLLALLVAAAVVMTILIAAGPDVMLPIA